MRKFFVLSLVLTQSALVMGNAQAKQFQCTGGGYAGAFKITLDSIDNNIYKNCYQELSNFDPNLGENIFRLFRVELDGRCTYSSMTGAVHTCPKAAN